MKQRIWYIDNLRIFLTFLVVAHHWAIANGGPGDWYYTENNLGQFGTLLLAIFVATNQAFFMGFFFFISAYFIPFSYKKKGAFTFLKERIIRLGIPLLFYAFIISPVLMFFSKKLSGAFSGGFWQFVLTDGGLSVGPMWFVALLLIFSILYLWIDSMFFGNLERFYVPIKKHVRVIGFVALILFTYFIRVYYPVGDWVPVIDVQPAHLTQYVFCFILGIWAKETNVLQKLSFKKSKLWFAIAQVLIFIGFPLVFLLGGATEDISRFMGGFTGQSFAFVVWEQLVAVSMILGVLGMFKKYFNSQNSWLTDLSQNSYAIYVFHGVVVIAFSAMFKFYDGNSMYKFILLLVPVYLFCYLLAKFVRSIPIVKRVL